MAPADKPNPTANRKVKNMDFEKVQLQMRADKRCRGCMRFSAEGKGSSEVCWRIYVQNKAFKEIGRPNVIMVTIEAVSWQDVKPSRRRCRF